MLIFVLLYHPDVPTWAEPPSRVTFTASLMAVPLTLRKYSVEE